MTAKPTPVTRRAFLQASGLAGLMVSNELKACPNALRSQPMNDDHRELVQLSATEMAGRVKKKEISPVDLIMAHIARINELGPNLNAVTHTAFEAALQEAQEKEKAIVQERVEWKSHPLFGVPISVKNHLDVEGIPTTAGVPAWENVLAKNDADVVRQLRAAGAIVLATTNMPCLALSYDSENLLFGRTNNPYDLTRTVGGSSGGEGGLVAACGSPLGVGSDNNGSIRLPSAWNGIAGLRPAPGRISLQGMRPIVEEDQLGAWAVGPMARCVADLELALRIFAKPNQPSTEPRLCHSSHVNLRNLRVATLTKWEHGEGKPISEIQKAVTKSADLLADRGAKVQEGIPRSLHRIGPVIVATMLGKAAFPLDGFRKRVRELGAEKDPLICAAIDWIDAWQRRVPEQVQRKDAAAFVDLQNDFSRFMEHVDALILPVHAQAAMQHGTSWPRDPEERCEEKYAYCYFCQLLGQHPAGTVRVGTTKEGLPVGVQVVGARYREDVILRILHELEAEFGGWKPPPSVPNR